MARLDGGRGVPTRLAPPKESARIETFIAKNDFWTYERWPKKLFIDAGLTRWPHDVLRHTNASFSYALHGDFDSLAASLGNSPAISRIHYIAPAIRKKAEQFLQLTPEKILCSLELKK